MPINAVCPKCNVGIKVPNDLEGKKVRCPKCKAAFQVPAAEEEEPDRPRSRSIASSAKADQADSREDTPRRKREEPEERKRQPARNARRKGVSPWALGAFAFLLLLIGGGIVGGVLFYRQMGQTPPVVAEVPPLPKPVVQWTNKDIDGPPVAGAKGVHLYVKGNLVRVVPISQPIQEKSVELWLTINDLEQKERTLMTVEDGVEHWDGIQFGVFPQQRYPASSYRHRSERLSGPPEWASPGELMHLVIVYNLSKRIVLYRNGKLHGEFVHRQVIPTFSTEKTIFKVGEGQGQYEFLGDIKLGRLYDRALRVSEIDVLYQDGRKQFLSN